MATIKKGTYKFKKTIAPIPSTIQLPYEFSFGDGREGYTDIYLADNVLQWRAGEGGFVNNVYNYETQTWEYDSERVIIVDTPQTVSKDFYEWFDVNIEHHTLKGKWKFRKELTGFSPSISIDQTVNFTCNGREQGGFRLYGAGLEYLSPGGSGNGLRYNWIDGGFWTANDTYRTVDFGETEQNVSQEFYDWFINNANEMSVIKAGTYTFNDTLTVPLAVTSYGYIYASPMSFRIVGGTYDLVSGSAMENGGSNFSVMLSELGWVDIYNYSSGWVGGEALKVSISEDFRTTDSLGIAFAIWFNTDAEFTSEKVYHGTSIIYAGRAIANLGEGHIATLLCADKTMASDVVVKTTDGAAAVSYNGKIIAYVWGEKTAKLSCKDKSPTHDIIVIAEPKPSEGLVYEESWNGTYGVDGIGTCTDTDIVIPIMTPDGGMVSYIASSAFSSSSNTANENISSVSIPEGVTSIGSSAFYNCKNLASVKIPKSVTSIGDLAFSGCTSLKKVDIPEGVSEIDDGVFNGCSSLASVVIPDTVTQIGEYAFTDCDSLERVVIPDSVTLLYRYAFNGCDNLEDVIFTENSQLTSISDHAFDDTSLKSIVIPRNVTYIGYSAFDEHLESITVAPENAKYHSEGNCLIDTERKALLYGAKNSVIPSDGSVTRIDNFAFDAHGDRTSIVIPSTITHIGYGAFRYCTNLVTDIPDGVITIDDYAFAHCTSLTHITIPDSVTTIGSHTFYNCANLESVTIGNSVTTIKDDAFYNCNKLEGVNITDMLAWVKIPFENDQANPLYFAHNLYLNGNLVTNLTIPDGVTSIGDYAFSNCSSITNIVIPASVTTIGEFAFSGCSGIANITVAPGNTKYHSSGNCLIETESKTLILGCKNSIIPSDGSVTTIGSRAFKDCANLKKITLPNSVTSIGDYAFSGCSSLYSMTIPTSVTNIGQNAFSGCSLLRSSVNNVSYVDKWVVDSSRASGKISLRDGTVGISDSAFRDCRSLGSIVIPDSVTTIGDSAFYWCVNLSSVTIGNGVTCIGKTAFYMCQSLTSIVIPDSVTSIGPGAFSECRYLTSAEIGNGVITIGDSAFNVCERLTSLTIGDSVTTIGDNAFNYCKLLTSVVIPESVTYISNSAFKSCSSLSTINVPWDSSDTRNANAPWGATNATINYNYTG